MSNTLQASTSKNSKGHRRVKSLVKELETQGTSADQAAATVLGNGLPTSSSSGSIRSLSGPASGHAHRPSLSHKDSASSLNSLSSINTDSATTLSSSTTADISPKDTRQALPSTQGTSHQPISATSPNKTRNFEFNYTQSPNWANSAEFSPKSSSVGPASSAFAWQALQPDMLDTPAEEKDDIFLPLASDSGSPFAVNFPNHRDPTSSDNGNGAALPSMSSREHSRRHSRIHSRNLSVFFPRPGENGSTPFGTLPQTPEDETLTDIPSASVQGWAGGSRGSMGSSASRQGVQGMNGLPSPEHEAKKVVTNRRGHHHRHSLSHNFSASTNQDGYSSGSLTPISPDAPKSVPSGFNFGSSHPGSSVSHLPTMSIRAQYGHLPTLVRLFLVIAFHLPFRTQLALLLSVAEIALGAALWIYGQSGESLAVTGLGYLVVFDGLGSLSSVVIEGNVEGTDVLWDVISPAKTGNRQIRYPFGTHRLTTISQFAQCIYLLFSAVYVCKESIEHVLLLHEPSSEMTAAAGGASHGSAHGSMDHGQGRGMPAAEKMPGLLDEEWVDIGIMMPTGLLLLSTLLALVSAVALSNHSSLTEAVGPSTYALRPRPQQARSSKRSMFSRIVSILSNPFSLLVLIFAFALSISSLSISGVQLAPLDKILALLESVAMFYVAYPAAEATGKVLLQTAPPSHAKSMEMLRRGLQDVENDPLVIYVPQPHVWQLTPHPRSDQPANFSSSIGRRSISVTQSETQAILVATVKVHIKADAGDQDIMRMTQFVREKCAHAFKSGDEAVGELTVSVVRGMTEEHHETHDSCSHDDSASSHSHGGHSHSQHHVEEPKAHSHSHSHAPTVVVEEAHSGHLHSGHSHEGHSHSH